MYNRSNATITLLVTVPKKYVQPAALPDFAGGYLTRFDERYDNLDRKKRTVVVCSKCIQI